jgi:hypothetical protein
MNKLIFTTSILASVAGGCVITSDATDLGHIAASWHVDSVDDTGHVTPTSCPQGVTTAALHTVAASSDGVMLDSCMTANDNCFIDLYDCDAFSGVTSPLPAQNYLTWIELSGDDINQPYAISTAGFVNITNVDMSFDTEILVDGGYFKLSWSLQGETSGQTVSCADTAASRAAGGSVEVTSTLVGSMTALSDKFDCEDHFGYSAPLPWGSYQIVMDALDSRDSRLGSQSTPLGTQVIGNEPNSIVDLGHVVLLIAGM